MYATSVFPSGRLPRRCAPRNDSGVKSVRLVCYPCSGVIVPTVWDFSAVSLRGQVGWRVYGARAGIWLARVRLFSFLLQGISRR